MRITPRLLHVASLLVAAGAVAGVACGGSTTASDDTAANTDGGVVGDGSIPKDAAGDEPVVGCGGCNCNTPADAGYAVLTGDQACELLESQSFLDSFVSSELCRNTYCPTASGCQVDHAYESAVAALNPDGGAPGPDDGGLRTLACPADAGPIGISCVEICVGRLTEGFAAPEIGRASFGAQLARMAYLEAVSVFAFERLERELAALGASPDLLRDARRARRDEVRHTAMASRLAKRNGVTSVELPEAPKAAPARTLFEVALENAVEGCVRETYGAVAGLVDAETSPDRAIRRAMRSIAMDECRHADLAWSVHAWAVPQLTAEERRLVEVAMKAAIDELAARDPKTTALLFTEPLAA